MDFFDKYVSNYDMNVKEINYKYYHSYRVMDNMVTIAKAMNLEMKDVNLAKCIGLLHDIARFEQFKRYHSFNDINMDHGDYGVEILKETDALKYFDIEKDDYDVVYKAIKNHNKYLVEDNLSKRELLFAKMIRDADKIDILYALGNKKLKEIFREDGGNIRGSISKQFYQNKLVKLKFDENEDENIIVLFSFIFDFNFSVSYQILKHNKYYEKIYERLKDKDKFRPYIEYVCKYISERC